MLGKKRFPVLILALLSILLLMATPLARGAAPAQTTTPAVPEAVSNYDLNRSCIIDREEVIRAIADYFAGAISRGDVLSLINFYFSGSPVRTAETYAAVDSDKESLTALYNATGGLYWTNNSRWLTDAPLSQWHGVTANDCGRVTGLSLGENLLSGELPAALGSLTSLQTLQLSSNQLSGGIPAALGNLTNLVLLHLSGNQLTGCVPVALRDVESNDFDRLGLDFCGPGGGPKETIIFSGLNWNSALLQNSIAQFIVEHGYGYPTDTVFAGTLPLFEALRRGETHVTMEIWLPNQSVRWEEALEAGQVISLGTSLGSEWQSAFVIPAYLQEQYPDLDSVEDLKQQRYKDLFATTETSGKARLVSCALGWACEPVNATQVTGYGLDEHVHIVNPGSISALYDSINDAYQRREPWLGYMWGTGPPALLLDLVRLEEPSYSDECWETTRTCAYEDSTILIGVHSSLPSLAPDVAEFLRNWDFTVDPHLKNTSRWQKANPDASIDEAALYWLANNVDTWSSWVIDEAAQGVLEALPES